MLADSCALGLVCDRVLGLCVAPYDQTPTAEKEPGDPCFADDPNSCTVWDLACYPDGVCRPWKQLGEACQAKLCAPDEVKDGLVVPLGLYCEGAGSPTGHGTCAEPPRIGEACDPLDWPYCGNRGDPELENGHCDPETHLCVVGGPPAVCLYTWLAGI